MDRALTAKGQATRARIVAGAARAIRERGTADLSLDELRAGGGASKGQMSHYFPGGKAELLVAAAEHEAEQLLADQVPASGRLATWRDWQAWQDDLLALFEQDRGQVPLGVLTSDLGRTSPEAQRIIAGLFERWHAFLADGVRALHDAGQMAEHVEPEAAALLILVTIQGGVSMMLSTGDPSYLRRALPAAVDLLRPPA